MNLSRLTDMSFWTIRPIAGQPHFTLSGWQVFEIPWGGPDERWLRHLVGRLCEFKLGQASQAVRFFNPETGSFETRQGHVYKVVAAPGMEADTEYVWNRLKARSGVVDSRDVTSEIFSAFSSAIPKSTL